MIKYLRSCINGLHIAPNPTNYRCKEDNGKGLQLDSNEQRLSSKTNTQTFTQTGQMVNLCCEYLSVRYIWLLCSYHVKYAFQSESTPYSCLNVTELFPRSRQEIWSLSEHISHLVLVFPLLTLNMKLPTGIWCSWNNHYCIHVSIRKGVCS